MTQVVLPELGEGIENATVAFWHCKAGDKVQKGDDIVELVTDKATFNVSAGATGILKEIFAAEGQQIPVGGPLATIDDNA